MDAKLGTAVLVLVAAVGIGATSMFSTISKSPTEDAVVSYCGTPDWFDAEQYENRDFEARCTGVQVGDLRIDVSKDSYGVSGWRCSAQYTVYRVKDNGELKKIHETGTLTDGKTKQFGDIEIHFMSGNSGIQFYNCEWVQTSYEYDSDGKFTFEMSTPEKVSEETKYLQTSVQVSNQYDRTVTGSIDVKASTTGAFGKTVSVTEKKNIEMGSGDSRYLTYNISLKNVDSNVKLTPSANLKIESPNGWKGVMLDCNSDNVVEPISECGKLSLGSKTGESQVVQIEKEGTFEKLWEEIVSTLSF